METPDEHDKTKCRTTAAAHSTAIHDPIDAIGDWTSCLHCWIVSSGAVTMVLAACL
jgi:hypothetical protein